MPPEHAGPGALHPIPDDRGDESFADDLNMGRGIVSGRVALLLRSTEIRPHRPNDLLPPSHSPTPGCSGPVPCASSHTWARKISPPLHSRVKGCRGSGPRGPGLGAQMGLPFTFSTHHGSFRTHDGQRDSPGTHRDSPRAAGLTRDTSGLTMSRNPG